MSKPEIIITALLASILVVEIIIEPDDLYEAGYANKDRVTYAASGIVDRLFPRDAKAKFANIVSDGVLAEGARSTVLKSEKMRISLDDKSLELRGITITPGNRFALLWDKSRQKSIIAQEGDAINTMKLIAIQNDRIVIKDADKEKEMLLRKRKHVKNKL